MATRELCEQIESDLFLDGSLDDEDAPCRLAPIVRDGDVHLYCYTHNRSGFRMFGTIDTAVICAAPSHDTSLTFRCRLPVCGTTPSFVVSGGDYWPLHVKELPTVSAPPAKVHPVPPRPFKKFLELRCERCFYISGLVGVLCVHYWTVDYAQGRIVILAGCYDCGRQTVFRLGAATDVATRSCKRHPLLRPPRLRPAATTVLAAGSAQDRAA